MFENIQTGRRTTFINEGAGSELYFITKARNPIIELDILKGKTQIEEKVTLNLSEIIDVKGMKAQGNRLSLHTIKSIYTDQVIETEEDNIQSSEKDEETPVKSENSEEQQKENNKKPSVDLEITNPEDIQIDDNGQMGLF